VGLFKLKGMKVNIIKEHAHYPLGEAEVDEDRARYLISCGIAVDPNDPHKAAPKKAAPKKAAPKKAAPKKVS
jgi:hypothetical protein